MTERIYDTDSHIFEFSAKVLSCIPEKEGFAVTLDRTAFFPGGGGQACDTGTLGGTSVTAMREEHGTAVHITDRPLDSGSTVTGMVDGKTRTKRMSLHSSDHVVSGIVHRRFGLENVGFHMGENDVTIDFDGFLSREQLAEVEREANETVRKNLPITVSYPSEDVLKALDYRSKLELTENVRIVNIAGVDNCACCAPHVMHTGEIGLIKILDSMAHRGGVRIRVTAGEAAYLDTSEKYRNCTEISHLLSVKPDSTADAVKRLLSEHESTKRELLDLKRLVMRMKLASIAPSDRCITVFEGETDMNILRDTVNELMLRAPICAAFSGKDGSYKYIIGSKKYDLRALAPEINRALNGRGGGLCEMIQGSAACSQSEAEAFFASLEL